MGWDKVIYAVVIVALLARGFCAVRRRRRGKETVAYCVLSVLALLASVAVFVLAGKDGYNALLW